MFAQLKTAAIRIDGLFLNADVGFDTKGVRGYCQDQEVFGNMPSNTRNRANEDYPFDDL
jgi:hypothetical protein